MCSSILLVEKITKIKKKRNYSTSRSLHTHEKPVVNSVVNESYQKSNRWAILSHKRVSKLNEHNHG